MTRYVVGIDPGKEGGVAFLPLSGQPSEAHPMPLTTEGAKEVVCGYQLARLLDRVGVELVVVEKVHAMPGQGVSACFSFGEGCGVVRGVASCLGHRLEFVTPQAWKKQILMGAQKGKTKAEQKAQAIGYATRAFPGVCLVPKGCRKPHDGMAEALCLAEWGRRLLTGKGVV